MVFQACNHPFVLQMDYAFQTELHVIIVLNLVTTGNLQVQVLYGYDRSNSFALGGWYCTPPATQPLRC